MLPSREGGGDAAFDGEIGLNNKWNIGKCHLRVTWIERFMSVYAPIYN